ncbi:hypothetical protein LCGC14_0403570 [marine sediment metagenome]|uniref:Portal protein n=1 Tax=marine sediment metagenome TaxID=412755 RepID=A0A0F9T1S9_9ZZZZ
MADTDTIAHPKTDAEILRKVQQMRSDGISGSANFFDRMRIAEDFVIGDQWEPGIKGAAKLKRKFTLTIPIIKPQIKQIAGAEIQNPQDFIIENTRDGTAVVAKLLTALTKQAADSERVRYEKSHAFESGLNTGQGVLGVFIDKTDDPKHANLRIEKLNEHNCLIDPNTTSYNPNKRKTGSKYMIYEEWVDMEDVEVEYPDQKDELAAKGHQSFLEVVAGNISGIVDWMTGRRSSRESSAFSARERTDIEVMTRNRYKVTHTWWREPKKGVHWYDDRKSEIDSVFLIRSDQITAAKKATKESEDIAAESVKKVIDIANEKGIPLKDPKVQEAIKQVGTPIFSIEEVNSFIMHHTIRVGDTFLADRVDELNGVQMFPLSFYWPYWINGYKSGVSEDLIGTQEEINWTHSMALNLIKQIARTGYRIAEDIDGGYETWLGVHGGEDGIVLNESRGGGKVEQLDPPSFAGNQYEQFSKSAMDNVKTITGRLDLPERDPKALSGRAKFLDIQKTQQGSMSLLNNWFYTLAIFGDLVVDIIRKNDIFSEDEIRETVDKDELIDNDILDQAKGIILNQIRQMGKQILEQPEPPNPILVRNAPPVIQAEMLEKFQKDMKKFEQFVNKVEQAAIPIAEDIMLKLIRNMKAGKYSTKVTTSPMGETMRTIKAIEVFELHTTLRESGDVGLNPDDLIDATDAPDKERLKDGRRELLETVRTA